MRVKDIQLKDYVKLSNRKAFDVFIESVEPRAELNGEPMTLTELTFDEMSVLKRMVASQEDDAQKIIVQIFADVDFFDLYLYDYIAFRKWLIRELVEMYKREEQLANIDVEMIKAGAEILNKYGELNTKIELAEQFGKLPSEIGKMNYLQVMQILAYNSDRNKVRKNLYK